MIPPLPMVLLASWPATALAMLLAWLYQRARENAAIVDAAWCGSFAVFAVAAGVSLDGDALRRGLVAAMGAFWGSRLAAHTVHHRLRGAGEDPRYRDLRRRWGRRAPAFFFLLFQAEALAIPLFLLPLLIVMRNPQPSLTLWDGLGLLVWGIAFGGEWIADRQLARFRAQSANKGKTCREGLWRYCRHPNYFFESLHWCAYVVMAIGLAGWWLTLIAPVLMTASLLFVSGIPLAERQALASRGDDYRDYQRTTSAFIPWKPKR